MTVRKAERRDTQGLLSLLSQVLELHHKGRPDIFKSGAVKYTEAELHDILSDSSRPVFVCCSGDDRVLGYCFCILEREENSNILTDIKTLYIDDLCVDESMRGQGIGKLLYEHALSFAVSEGCYNVTLNVWALNESALRFYEKLGMSPLKTYMEQIL